MTTEAAKGGWTVAGLLELFDVEQTGTDTDTFVGPPVEFAVTSCPTATALVHVTQNGKRGITVTVFTDVPSDDVIRHRLPKPDVVAPADANHAEMPMVGRQLRLVDVVDVNSPDEVGPPELHAWLHYHPIPVRRRCGRTRASAPRRRTSRCRRLRWRSRWASTSRSGGTAGCCTPTRAPRSERECPMSAVRCTPRRVRASAGPGPVLGVGSGAVH